MTDRPSALVSVPREPTQEMVDRAQEFWPDIRDMWSAMLAAAPAAPQAAGVGEEAIDRFERAAFANVQNLPRGEAARAAEMDRRDVEYKAARLALRAPSREPEGGAVDYEAVRIATDLHTAFEKLIYGLPKYLDAENLTDEENMIREAWITLDVTAHRLAALATREEAPSEAGELKADFSRSHTSGMDDCTYEQIEFALDRADAPISGPDGKFLTLAQRVEALRSQPQAREDALRVAVDDDSVQAAVPVGHPMMIAWERYSGGSEYANSARWAAEPEHTKGSMWAAFVAGWSARTSTHPAPDALRVAAADLLAEVDATAARIGWADHGQRERLRRALAALQQGAK